MSPERYPPLVDKDVQCECIKTIIQFELSPLRGSITNGHKIVGAAGEELNHAVNHAVGGGGGAL